MHAAVLCRDQGLTLNAYSAFGGLLCQIHTCEARRSPLALLQ